MKPTTEQPNISEVKAEDGKVIYYEKYDGFWLKYEYDLNGNETYYENSGGFWRKREYDSDGNEIYFENSNGVVRDNRPAETIIVHPNQIYNGVVIINGIKYKRID